MFNYEGDSEWVTMVGRYMLNMGIVELSTKELIAHLSAVDATFLKKTDTKLHKRIEFLIKEFPKTNQERYLWAMNVFAIATKHTGFRNSIAHSGLVITETAGKFHIHGILDTPKNAYSNGKAELISLEELKGRVTESAMIARDLLDMQKDFL